MPADRTCIVVGAGLLGLSTAWSLGGRGWDVTVLDAGASLGHERSGSKGDARIFRLGYREAHYVEMALLARDRWRALEAAAGRRLLYDTGQLTFGDAEAVTGVGAGMAAHGAPAEPVSGADAARRWPGVATHGPVLYEPASGVLAADACLRALCETGEFAVHWGARVAELEPAVRGVRVHIGDGAPLEADVVVACAGPATLDLARGGAPAIGPNHLGAGASLPQVAYFAHRSRPDGGEAAMLPVFIEWSEDMVYGLPVPADAGGARAGTFKVSCHAPGARLEDYDPAATTPLRDDVPLLDVLIGAVRRLLPALDPEPVATERCVYDNSTDTDFVLDRVGDVVVGCGTSGHGFKFGPLLGEALADLAEGRHAPFDLGPFRLDRRPAPGR